MDSLSIMAIGGAATSAAAPFLSLFTAKAAQKRQFEQQKELQQRGMDYSERMSNTAYQRGMADMKAAGLNPILASKLGGASTPQASGGSGASMDIPDFSQIGTGISSAVQMISQREQLKNTIRKTDSDIDLQSASAEEAKSRATANYADASLKSTTEDKVRGETEKVMPKEIEELIQRAKLHAATARNLESDGEKKAFYSKMWGTLNKLLDKVFPPEGGRPGVSPGALKGAIEKGAKAISGSDVPGAGKYGFRGYYGGSVHSFDQAIDKLFDDIAKKNRAAQAAPQAGASSAEDYNNFTMGGP